MTMLEAALRYAARGWAVFPVHGIDDDGLCTCGKDHDEAAGDKDKGKHPVSQVGLKSATKDPDKIRAAWGSPEGQHWNIGVRTGEVSDLTVLDIDIGEGKAGADTWSALNEETGEPDTLMATTGSGGAHVLFRYSSSLKTSSNTLGPGVDCRNDGGYIVAAPSRHRSGGTYSWVNYDAFVGERGLPPLPAHLSKRVETRGRKKGDAAKFKKYTTAQAGEMLRFIDAGDRDLWRNVGIILGREFDCSDEAWDVYVEWSDSWGGAKGRNHDGIMREAFYTLSKQQSSGASLSMGTLVAKAIEGGWNPAQGMVDKENFIFYGPGNNFMYRPTGTFWIQEAVNAVVGLVRDDAGNLLKASAWVQRNFPATSMSKLPGVEQMYVKDHDARDGVLFPMAGAAAINTYRPADIELGDARLAGPFLDHVKRVFNKPGDAEQFLNYMAQRAQQPEVKPRFALMIAGEMGTGKDTAIEFCIPALGAWNVSNIEPSAFDSHFNAFAASALVRISEAANLQDMNKWAFNERIKVLIAGNPDVQTINPKYGSQYEQKMYCGVIITTNHLATGIYIPPGDRRYDVIEAATRVEMGFGDDLDARAAYFGELYDWFGGGGAHHVAALLMDRDVSKWSAANGQRITEAHRAVVAQGMSSEAWLVDALDELGSPKLVRADAILAAVEKQGALQRKDAVTRLATGMSRLNYVTLRCPQAKDGRWRMADGKKTGVYMESSLTILEAMGLVAKLQLPF